MIEFDSKRRNCHHRNQSNDFLCKSIDLLQFDGNPGV